MTSDIIFKKNNRKEGSKISKVFSGRSRERRRPPKRKRMKLEKQAGALSEGLLEGTVLGRRCCPQCQMHVNGDQNRMIRQKFGGP